MPDASSVRPSALTALLLASAALLAPDPARAAHDVVSFVPEHPTWQEPVTVVVDTDHLGCGAELLEPRYLFESGTGWIIEIEVDDDCAVGIPSPTPITLTTTLERVRYGPGPYTVRIIRESGIGHVTETELLVYGVADEKLTISRPARSDAPVEMSLEVFASCAGVEVESQPDRGRVLLHYFSECHILPPDATVQERPIEAGPLPAGLYDVVVIDHDDEEVLREQVVVHDADRCVPSETRLCLNHGRFAVEATWEDFEGGTGVAHARPLGELEDSGLLWFFDEENVELTVKALRGCNINGFWWIFLASGSDAEYHVTVTDTASGTTREYHNDLGERSPLIPDTTAFPCS